MAEKQDKGGLTRIQLALGMAVFGSATPVSKIVTGAMPVFVGSVFRVGLGALVLAPFAWRKRGEIRTLTGRDWLLVGLIALFGMFGFSALMLYGMKMVSGVVGAIVMSTAPAVTAAASMLFFGDSPTWRKLTAIALAVAGVLLLQLGQGSDGGSASEMWLGAALVFAAAIWYGAGTLSLGTWLWYSGLAKAEGAAVAAAFMGVMPVSALLLSTCCSERSSASCISRASERSSRACC